MGIFDIILRRCVAVRGEKQVVDALVSPDDIGSPDEGPIAFSDIENLHRDHRLV